MKTFNNIGIDEKLDWERIRHLMTIGLIAGIMVLVGDMLEGGWGACESLGEGLMYLTACVYWKKVENWK